MAAAYGTARCHHGAVAKTLVTGATGLVGSHVARALVERGDDVRVTVRESSRRGGIADLDVERGTADGLDPRPGRPAPRRGGPPDVLDRRQVRRALRGVDRLFHVAGTTNLRSTWREQYRTNVEGTRIVLEEALRAGVERAVHTSSVAAIGPARRGSTADERQ